MSWGRGFEAHHAGADGHSLLEGSEAEGRLGGADGGRHGAAHSGDAHGESDGSHFVCDLFEMGGEGQGVRECRGVEAKFGT
eukprot:1179734-Prorocentrum_minimum.AAC.3